MLNNSKAFSLIELSIVLIIIGLLVAGITGGATLIENAKVNGAINEVRSYMQGIAAFQVAKGRLPGDLNNSGKIGYISGQKYNDSSFGGNYVSSNQEYGVPSDRVAPFVDLYLEGVIDFEPKKIEPSNNKLEWNNGGAPISKNIPSFSYHFQYADSYNNPKYPSLDNLFGNRFVSHYKGFGGNEAVSPTILQKIDEKIDDGFAFKGKARSVCNNLEYEESIERKHKCTHIYYKLNFF